MGDAIVTVVEARKFREIFSLCVMNSQESETPTLSAGGVSDTIDLVHPLSGAESKTKFSHNNRRTIRLLTCHHIFLRCGSYPVRSLLRDLNECGKV